MSARSQRARTAAADVLAAVRRLLHPTSASRSAFEVAVTNGFVLAINVLTGIVTARALGAGGRGEFAALMLWPQFLGYAFAFALPSAVTYCVRSSAPDRSPIAGAALLLSAIGGVIAAVGGAAALPWLLPHAPAETVARARWLMVFAPFATISTVSIALVQSAGNFGLYNRIRYVPLLLTLGALVVLALGPQMSPLTAALAYLVAGVPVFVWALVWVGRNFRPSLRDAPRFARRLLSYGGRAYGGEAASTLLAQMDKIVLVSMLAPSAYGVYVVAFNLSRLLTMLSTAITPVLLPKSAGRSATEVTAMTGRALSFATPLTVLGAAGFALGGGLLLRLLYGPDFVAGRFALGLLAAEAALASAAYILLQPFLALNRPGVVTIIQACSLVALLAAIYALVPRFGMDGAAAAVLIATALRALCIYLVYEPLLHVPAPRLWPEDLRSVLPAGKEAR